MIVSLFRNFLKSNRVFSRLSDQGNLDPVSKQTLEQHFAEGLNFLKEKNVKEARSSLIKAADLSNKVFPNSKEQSDLLNSIGRQFEVNNELETALGFYMRAFNVDKVVHEKDEELLAAHSNRIGAILADLGELEKANEYLSGIQRVIEKSANTELKAAYFGNFGHVKMRLGDNKLSLQYFIQAKDYQTKVNPKDEILTKYLQSIGMCYWVQGDHQQAKKHFFETLDLLNIDRQKNILEIIDIYTHLGYLHNDMRETEMAFKYFENAVFSFKSSTLSDKNIKILDFIINIVKAVKSAGDFDQTKRYIDMYLDFSRETFNEHSRETANGYNMYSLLYLAKKSYQQALEFTEKSVNIVKTLNENHYDLLKCFNQFAVILHRMGELEAAEKFLMQSEDILKNHPNENMQTNHYHNLALLYRDQKKTLEAEEMMTLHVRGVQKQFGELHPATASAYLGMGHIYRTGQNFNKAKEYYSKALSVFDQTFGRDHLETSDSLDFLGEVCRIQKNFEESLQMHNEALRIKLAVLGDQHPALHISFFNLSCTYLEMKRFKEAESFAQKRLEILKKTWGNDHIHVAGNLSFLADIYLNQGENEKAVEALQEAASILKATKNTQAAGEIEKRIKEIRLIRA